MKRDEVALLQRQKKINKRRTPGKGVLVKILWGFVVFVLAANLLSIGISFKQVAAELWPGRDPVVLFNGFLLYWFCFEFMIRYMVQSLPVMDVVPYLHLPVQKSSLIRFLQIKGVSHPANYLTFLFFVPLAFSTLKESYTSVQIFFWLLALLGCTWFVTVCALHVKRRDIINSSSSLLFLLVIAAIGVADYCGWLGQFSLTPLSGHIFGGFAHYPFLCMIPFVLALCITQWNYRFLYQHAYIDEAIQKKQDKIELHGSLLGKYFGLTGALIDLDIKMAWRNKRTRTQIYFIPLFLLYGFILYPNTLVVDHLFMLCFVGAFLSSYPMIMYGQMPYDSVYFEGQMSRITLGDYIKSRHTLFASLTVISYIVTLPYAFFGGEVLKINFACFLFNLGVTPLLMLHLAAFNRKGVDLSLSSAMNVQGVTFTQFLVVFPLVFFPAIVSAIFGTIWVVLGLGVLGICTLPWQLKWVKSQFVKHKLDMIEGFRKK